MKKKVLFVITKSNWGGAQRYVYNLATNLPSNTCEISVALGGTGLAGSAEGELNIRLKSDGIQTFYIEAFARNFSLTNDIRALFELYKLFKKEQPDVVHLNSSKAGGVGALAARFAGIKNIVFTSHGLAWDEDRLLPARLAIQLLSWCTFLLCHKVIVISRDNFTRTQTLPFCRKKIFLVHNGLPELKFETRERARVSLALKTGLTESGESFWIGTIAELTRNKGLSYLIDAAKILKGSGKNLHIFIIGGGEEAQNLADQISKNNLSDCVHMVGFVSDGYRWDKAFDVFALTSIKEGLPTALLEAGQAGIAALASNISGVPDIIEDGVSGLLIRPRDAKDAATKIEALFNNAELRNTLAANLKQKVAHGFSIERMVAETENLY